MPAPPRVVVPDYGEFSADSDLAQLFRADAAGKASWGNNYRDEGVGQFLRALLEVEPTYRPLALDAMAKLIRDGSKLVRHHALQTVSTVSDRRIVESLRDALATSPALYVGAKLPDEPKRTLLHDWLYALGCCMHADLGLATQAFTVAEPYLDGPELVDERFRWGLTFAPERYIPLLPALLPLVSERTLVHLGAGDFAKARASLASAPAKLRARFKKIIKKT